jgi:hypothetical protein
MISENEIRQRTIAYLKKHVALDDFEDWIVETSWNMHRDSEVQAIELANVIEAALIEYADSSAMTESALRARLIEALSHVVSSVAVTDDSVVLRLPVVKRATNSSRLLFVDSHLAIA